MLKKENRGDAVFATINLRFGTPDNLVGKSTAAEFAAMMLSKGTKSMSRQQIEDKLNELKSRINIFGGSSSASVRIESTNENLPAVLDLMADMLKNSDFKEEEFNKLIEEQLAGLEEQLAEPNAIASEALSKITNPYPKSDVRYSMTMREEIEAIKALKLDDVKKFYKDFYGATNASVSIVGDFDEKIATEKLEKHLSDWKSASPFRRITYPHVDVKQADQNLEAPDKANAVFMANLPIKMNDSHPDYAAMIIGNYMMGGGFLNSRLATRIRQKEGLSYGVNSYFSASSLDESATFGAYAIYAPENRDKVQKAFIEEIEKVRKEGFSKEELEAAKSGWLQSRTVGRAQDNSLVSKLASNLYLDRDMQFDEALEEKIKNISLEEVNKVMAKYIDPNKIVYVKSGDFAKAMKESKP
jgi:zinc protease